MALKTRGVPIHIPDGSQIVDFRVAKVVGEVDCVGETPICSLRFQIGADFIEEVFELQFDPGKSPSSNSVVTPQTGLSDGDTVTVTVAIEDLLGGSVGIHQCGYFDGKLLPSTCKALVRVSAPGGSHEVSVQRFLDAPKADTSWDCASAPKACAIVLVSSRISRFNLTFDAVD